MLKKLLLRSMGTSLVVGSISVLGVTFATVTTARADEHCPVCHPINLTCDGSPCECRQTGPGTGVWKCYPPGA